MGVIANPRNDEPDIIPAKELAVSGIMATSTENIAAMSRLAGEPCGRLVSLARHQTHWQTGTGWQPNRACVVQLRAENAAGTTVLKMCDEVCDWQGRGGDFPSLHRLWVQTDSARRIKH